MIDEKNDEVRLLNVGENKIGIVGLSSLLEEAKKRDFQNEEELVKFLLDRVKTRNYIPHSRDDKYSKALLREYKKFTGASDEEDVSGDFLEIKILGPSCYNCQRLEQETMSAIAEMNIPANIEHVRNPVEIGSYGVFGTPALIVNNELKSVGRVLKKDQIKRLLSEELKKGE